MPSFKKSLIVEQFRGNYLNQHQVINGFEVSPEVDSVSICSCVFVFFPGHTVVVVITRFFTGVKHAILGYFEGFDGAFECFTRCHQGVF